MHEAIIAFACLRTPASQGRQSDIDAEREFYERLAEPYPFRRLWRKWMTPNNKRQKEEDADCAPSLSFPSTLKTPAGCR